MLMLLIPVSGRGDLGRGVAQLGTLPPLCTMFSSMFSSMFTSPPLCAIGLGHRSHRDPIPLPSSEIIGSVNAMVASSGTFLVALQV